MKNSSCRGIEVFDFKEEDELPELVAGKYLGKFKNPDPYGNATLKCDFLECVAQGANVQAKKVGSVPFVDVDLVDCDHSHDGIVSLSLLGPIGEHLNTNDEHSVLDVVQLSDCTSHHEDTCFEVVNCEIRSSTSEYGKICSSPQEPLLERNSLNCIQPESPSTKEPVDVISDSSESMNECSHSSPASEIANDGVPQSGYLLDPTIADVEMDNVNKEIVLHPDYIVYRDNYCTGPLLTFSHSGIKINCFSACRSHGFFNFECGIDDLVDIECQWFHKGEMIMIKLHIISNDAIRTNNESDTSGFDEVKIAVVDSNWSEKQEKITSLNFRYMAVWNAVSDVDIGTDGDDSLGQRHYFPNFDEPFEDVVYPKGDSDAVTISKRDVDLLQPETFVNDTIIDFYIKYVKNQIEPEERHRFHFFNSFFFRKLADLDKDPSSAADGRAAFLRVRKWTRKVDFFRKDYVFIPINFNLHWSLIVICHPGEVANFNDEDLEKSLKVPCILHMDSIKGSHGGLKNLIQSYLWEEWKERHKETLEDISTKFFNLRFLPLELPQQENSYDCGLFLLHYLELFLTEAPVSFNPFKISKFSEFLNVDWFLPAEASQKRTLIQRLIFELLENRSREMSLAACSDELASSKFPENNKNETAVEFLSERCSSPAIACNGIEITLLSAFSRSNNQCDNNSSLVVRELFETGTSAGPLLGQYQSVSDTSSYHHNGGPSVMQEDAEEKEESGEHFVYLPTGECGFQQMVGIESQPCSFPCSSRGFGAETSYGLENSTQPEHEDAYSSPETSTSSDDSEDVGIVENCSVQEVLNSSQLVDTYQEEPPLLVNMESENGFLASLSKEDSQDNLNTDEDFENGGPDPDNEVADNREAIIDIPIISDCVVLDSPEQHVAKKPRLTESLEAENKSCIGLSNETSL